jgi:hypothetical protein
MNNQTSFGEWLLLVVTLIALLLVLTHIGQIDDAVQKMDTLKVLFTKGLSGSFV